MKETQIKRTLKAIERDKAEMAAEIARLDRAAEALRALLPVELRSTPSSNGASISATVRPATVQLGKRRRGMKEAIATLLKSSPNVIFTVAELRRYLDDRGLINPAAQNPEKMIGTALARLREEDRHFTRVDRGKYTYEKEYD